MGNTPLPNIPYESLPHYAEGGSYAGMLKLSSNENPFPIPYYIRRVLRKMHKPNRYPPKHNHAVTSLLAKKFSLLSEQCVLGNGSDELMWLIAQAYLRSNDEVIIAEHSFSIYAHVAKMQGAVPVYAKMHDGSVDIANLLEKISSRTKIIFLASPNNPTGGYINTQDMNMLLSHVPTHIMIVIDHAYAEFCDASDFVNAETVLSAYANVVTLRTFSKLYGLAGLRIGYAMSHSAIIAQLRRVRMPFSVNSYAQSAAEAVLLSPFHFVRMQKQIISFRTDLYQKIQALGYSILHTYTNFICIALSHDSMQLADFFLAHNIVVRPLHSFGLPHHIRISIGTGRMNRRVVRVLSKYQKR